MKITKNYLKQVIKEELTRIIQETELNPQQQRIVDMFNNRVTQIRPSKAPFKYSAIDKSFFQLDGEVTIVLEDESKAIQIPIQTKIKISEMFPTQASLSDFRNAYNQLAGHVIAAIENHYNKKFGIINLLPHDKMMKAWKAGESQGEGGIGNLQKLVADLRSAGAVAGKPAAANPKSAEGTMP